MQTVAFLAIATVLLNIAIGVRVYLANPNAATNRLFLLLCGTLSIWGFGYAFMITADSAVAAMQWRTVSAVGWCSFYSVFLLFAIRFTNYRGWLNKRVVQVLLPVPALVFFWYNAMLPPDNLTFTAWGWVYLYSRELAWQTAFIIYYSSYVLTGFGLIYRWGRQAASRREKNQAQVIVRTMLAVYIIAAPFDTYLPMLGYPVPSIAILMSSFFAAGIWYAITRYKLLQLNFDTAASHILHNMIEPVLLVGPDATVREANASFCDWTGFSGPELIGRPLQQFILGLGGDAGKVWGEPEMTGMGDQEVFLRLKQSRREIPCLLSSKMLRDEFGDVLGMILVLHDISSRKCYEELLKQANDNLEDKVKSRTVELAQTNQALQREIAEREAAQKKLSYAANFDLLTGLPNRRQFCEKTDVSINKAKELDSSLAVIFIDLDDFKSLNDSYGHGFGDRVLESVGGRLRAVTRENDFLARIGGDEFLLLLEGFASAELKPAVEGVLRRLQEASNQAIQIDEREIFLSASMGIAIYPDDGLDGETMIRNADIAMYVAKREGKNHFRYCSSLMKNKVSAQNQIRNQLFQAMGKNELELHYQPKVDLKTQAIVGVEALLRWRLGQKTLISPAKFIPIAEETGLIVLMGTWVLQQALLQLKRWHEQGFTQLTMAVNLSARQLRDAAFAEQALAVINESGLLASQIELEITESIAFARDKAIVSNIDRLKAHCFTIAIDDFGTDYSSLINMKMVSFDCLKIPKDFISGIGKDAKDEAIVSSIIELTRKLRIKVIAEGVERLEEVAFLRNAGCDEIQGFYYYRPMEAEKIEALLHDNRNRGSQLVGSDVN